MSKGGKKRQPEIAMQDESVTSTLGSALSSLTATKEQLLLLAQLPAVSSE